MSLSPVWWSEEQYNDYGGLRRCRSLPIYYPANRVITEVHPLTPGRIWFDEFDYDYNDANGEESPPEPDPELPRQRDQSTSTDDLKANDENITRAATTSAMHFSVVHYGEGTLNFNVGTLQNPVININLQCGCCGVCCSSGQ